MITLLTAQLDHPDDQEFMIQLYEEFAGLMFSVAGQYISNWSDQEDIIQDSLVSLMKKIDFLRTKNRCILVSYIVSTIRNTSINHLRKQNKAVLPFSAFGQSETPPREFSADELAMLVERKDEMHRIWDCLSERDRFLLSGRYLYGLSDREMAEQLGCKADSIRMLLSRARKTALHLLTTEERKEEEDLHHDKT